MFVTVSKFCYVSCKSLLYLIEGTLLWATDEVNLKGERNVSSNRRGVTTLYFPVTCSQVTVISKVFQLSPVTVFQYL